VKAWDDLKKIAAERGLIVVDVRDDFMKIEPVGSCGVQNDPESCRLWWYADPKVGEGRCRSRVCIPVEHRTLASRMGGYWHNSNGGKSWAVPYLVGVCAMALQINPSLQAQDLREIIEKSVSVNTRGYRVLNPRGVVNLAGPEVSF
jgi:hypothetical protein